MKKLHFAAKDLTGRKFGLLTVLHPTSARRNGKVVWVCSCECGTQTEADSGALITAYKRSCGCLARQPLQQQPKLLGTKSIAITKPWIVQRVLDLAAQSHTSPKTWIETALEDWILKHRSGRYNGDPTRFDARNADRTAEYFD